MLLEIGQGISQRLRHNMAVLRVHVGGKLTNNFIGFTNGVAVVALILHAIGQNADKLGILFNANIRHCHSPLIS